jgi:hypothetical protein
VVSRYLVVFILHHNVIRFEGINTIYGLTLNPYDTRKTCGGSSSGEGALLGAGSMPFGIGSFLCLVFLIIID